MARLDPFHQSAGGAVAKVHDALPEAMGLPSLGDLFGGGDDGPSPEELRQQRIAAERKAKRDSAFLDTYNTTLRGKLPDWFNNTLIDDKARTNFARNMLGRKKFARGLARLGVMRALDDNYNQPETDLRNYSMGQLEKMDRGERLTDRSPIVGELSSYARERLGTGLTPAESAALLNPQLEAIESQYAEGRRQVGNQVAASGGDPRASAAAAGRLENQREAARAQAQRDLTVQELGRKREIEGLSQNVAGLEQGEINRELDWQKQQQGLANSLASLAEDRRQYDYGFIESRRQAAINRDMMRSLARRAQPTGLENTAAILGGVRAGIGEL